MHTIVLFEYLDDKTIVVLIRSTHGTNCILLKIFFAFDPNVTLLSVSVRSVTHVSALTVFSKNVAPGEKPKLEGVLEQRVTSFLVHILIGNMSDTLLANALFRQSLNGTRAGNGTHRDCYTMYFIGNREKCKYSLVSHIADTVKGSWIIAVLPASCPIQASSE